jgi:4-hydroxyphenylpyruvate dioxygenase
MGDRSATAPGTAAETDDFLSIRSIDHLEFWVGNARQAAFFLSARVPVSPHGLRGAGTGVRDRASYAPGQGALRADHAARPRGP